MDGKGHGRAVSPVNFLRIQIITREQATMPHISVKMHPGRTELQKTQLAERIVKDVLDVIRCEEKVVSVTIEEVKPEDWAQKVYKPDILENRDKRYKKPGYNPFE
jgi:4-oxalocrotonate tautomerase